MKKQKRVGAYKWTKDEEQYLIKNYRDTPNSVLMEVLGKSRHSISAKAFQLKLSKNEEVIEYNSKGQPLTQTYREETPLAEDIICFYHRRGVEVAKISRETKYPVKQVEEILERCINNGRYEYYAQQENRGIKFDKDSPLIAGADTYGAKRGWAEKYD